MKIIGLTGPSGAGKGYVAAIFASYGVPSIDTDVVYHELTTPPSACLDELTACFGKQILTPSGTLNRRALAAIVFAPGAGEALAGLNRITHRHVLAEVRRRCGELDAAGCCAVLVDAPQLFESGFDAECDRVLVVLAPRDIRLSRIMERDGLERARAEARLNAQKPDDFFREHADGVIVNDGMADPAPDVRRLLTEWEVPYAI